MERQDGKEIVVAPLDCYKKDAGKRKTGEAVAALAARRARSDGTGAAAKSDGAAESVQAAVAADAVAAVGDESEAVRPLKRGSCESADVAAVAVGVIAGEDSGMDDAESDAEVAAAALVAERRRDSRREAPLLPASSCRWHRYTARSKSW